MFILINCCQKKSDINCSFYSATSLNEKVFQSKSHDLLNTIVKELNNCMGEQNIGDLQCMVWHNNNRAKEMCWSKRKQNFFQ